MAEPKRDQPEESYKDEKIYSDVEGRPEGQPIRPEEPIAYRPASVRPTGETGRPVVDRTTTTGPLAGWETAIDSVRWGPILAGLFVAITVQVFLFLIGLAVGLTTATVGDLTGPIAGLPTGMAIWGALGTLVAFFIGGFVAGRSSAVESDFGGMINGLVVFCIALVLGMVFSGLGAAAFLGPFGLSGVAIGDMASAVWWFLLWFVLSACAAAIGGLLGSRSIPRRTIV